ncbi:hypothetical protein HY439_00810 [Candidatus Microgenomates bacterium]|nr:hypothetical protein [Candidatus Microgenomates bacterium]
MAKEQGSIPFFPGEAERVSAVAQRLGIPSVLKEVPTTVAYLRLHVALDDFLGVLRNASVNAGFAESLKPEQRTKDKLEPSIKPSLTDRYARAAHLITIAMAMTEEGLGVREINPDFMKENLDMAFEAYGLYTADLPSDYDRNPYASYYDPSSKYHERLNQYQLDYKERTKEAEEEYRKSYVMFYKKSKGQGVQPASYYAHLPYMRDFANILNNMPDLMRRAYQVGLHTPLQEGYCQTEDGFQSEYIREILGAANEMLCEHVGGYFSLDKIIYGLNYVLDKYNLHVDVKPYVPPILERPTADRNAEVKVDEEEECHWEQVGRDFQLDLKAVAFGIPEKNWEHPMVRHFLGTVIDSRELQRNLSVLSNQSSTVLQTLQTGNYEMILDAFPDLSLSQRCYSAELMMRGICEIIENGFQGAETHPSYLAEKIGAGLGAYGLDVKSVSGKPPTQNEKRVEGMWQNPHPKKNGIDGVFHKYYYAYGRENYERYSAGTPNRNDRDRRRKIDETGVRFGVQQEYLKDPIMRTFLDYFNDAENLKAKFEEGEFMPAHGLTPSIANRYKHCAAMMDVVVKILETGFQGKRLNPAELKQIINQGVMPYGVRVLLNPKYVDPDTEKDVQERFKQWKEKQGNDEVGNH